MGDSPRAVSNQRKGSRFPARPFNHSRGLEPETPSFRGGRFTHCATWMPYTDYTINVDAPPQVVRVMQGVVRTCTSFFTRDVYELPHAFTLWRDRIS